MLLPQRALLIGASSAILLASLSHDSQAQSLISFHGQVIASTGDTVPGLAGGELFGGSTFDSAVIDDAGNVLFRGRFVGATTSNLDDRAYFLGATREDLTLVVRNGDPEPTGTIPGATLNTATSGGLSGSPRISADGTLFFGSSFYDGLVNVNSSNDSAIFWGVPGNFAILAREGSPAPGTVGATYSSSFSSPSQQLTCINPSNQVFYRSSLAGGDVVGTTNDDAWFTGSPANPVIAVRKGDVATGGEVVGRISPGFLGMMNAAGQVIYDVEFLLGTGTTPVTDLDDRALWIYTPGIGNQQLAREGDATPIPGTTFNKVASPSWSFNTGSTTLTNAGEFLCRLDLDGAVTANVDDSAIFKLALAGHTLVARRGDLAPGTPGLTMEVFNNSSLQLANSGFVAFQTSLGGAVTTADDSAIFAGMPGSLALVAREGDVAPGTGGGVFGSMSGQSMLMNNAGQLLFANSLIGGASPGSSMWAWDPTHGLTAAVLSADPLETQPGVFVNMTSAGGVQFSNGNGRPLSLADDGDFVVRVGDTSGGSNIVRGHIGDLYAAPEFVSVTTGGVHKIYLNTDPSNAGLTYLIGGSFSDSPGFSVAGKFVPLNPDAYFFFSIQNANLGVYSNTIGVVDAAGRAKANITIPSGIGVLQGLHLFHAAMGFNGGGTLKFATEATSLTLSP